MDKITVLCKLSKEQIYQLLNIMRNLEDDGIMVIRGKSINFLSNDFETQFQLTDVDALYTRIRRISVCLKNQQFRDKLYKFVSCEFKYRLLYSNMVMIIKNNELVFMNYSNVRYNTLVNSFS